MPAANQGNFWAVSAVGIGGTAVDPASAGGSLIDLPTETVGLLPLGQLPAHAPSHKDGGSDEVATAVATADAIPKADAAAKLDTWISTSAETVSGLIEIATQVETDAGVDDLRAVTPAKLSAFSGLGTILPIIDTTAVVKGSLDATKLVRIEADGLTTGTTRVITMPDKDASLGDPTEAASGLIEIATQVEVDAGTDDVRAVTPLKLTSFSGLGGVFGSEFNSNEEIVAVTNTTTTFVNHNTLTLTTVPVGSYAIYWFYLWSHQDTGTNFEARIQVDNTTELLDPNDTGLHRSIPVNAGLNQRYSASGFSVETLTAATHTIDLDFTTDSVGKSSKIHHSFLMAWRVS